ncbi:4-hydroxyproline epimerase [Uruburuella testudinis]|uniref:4-hydroxyproline epimerase n=1 Tax=Uruburuella testudinis TaxID=1282863 RepID=A0ABY4DUE1_9NEIS|nr:4-hydroxyproline epimerase [Uruburuella testudinis]UOO82478.1 4-hydroxyproline epimerase [Uruburuella testudinis]
MSNRYHAVKIIDSHTAGEPTRMVYQGFPDLGGGTMAERLHILKTRHDAWRKAVILEPRGNDILVGALLCKPQNPAHTCGVIFFNNSGYLGMCGHGTIGLLASLAYLGAISAGKHIIETPVGDIQTTLHEDGSVSLQNVHAYRYQKAVAVDVPGIGRLKGDIAWGGNWFFLVNEHQERLSADNTARLTHVTQAIMQALQAQGICGERGAPIDHIELFAETAHADSRNFVLCPGGAYDRSPCGTGTSAKLACLAADGRLPPDTVWQQESIIGSRFQAWYTHAADACSILPNIRGQAWVCAENTLLIDEQDPFKWGIS